jgi:hypothetical protein
MVTKYHHGIAPLGLSLWLALLVGCSGLQQGAQAPTRSDLSGSLKEMDNTIARLDAIGSAIKSIQRRRVIVFYLSTPPGYSPTATRPTQLFDRLSNSGPSEEKSLLIKLLNIAAAGDPLPFQLTSRQCDHTGSFAPKPEQQGLLNNGRARTIAKTLDAVALISTQPCRSGTAINSEDAGSATDTNWSALADEARRESERVANTPFLVPAEDRAAFMVGQGYRFSGYNDDVVPIPEYVARQITLSIHRVATMLLPYATNTTPVKVVFDRMRTYNGQKIFARSPLGWFAAVANPYGNEIYVSPTLIRASFVACGSALGYDVTLPVRLRKVRQQVADGRSTPADAAPVTGNATLVADQFDQCIGRETDFLFGHELSHAMLGTGESRADCIGRSVAVANGHSSAGIFQTLVFGLVGTSDVDLLGISDPTYLSRLACRAKISTEAFKLSPPRSNSLDVMIPACMKQPSVCE